MQTRRVLGVGMPDFDHDKVTAFEVDHTSLEFLGEDQVLRNLAGIARIPEIRDEFWRHLLPHDLQNVRRCNRFGIWKPIQEGADTKEMIAVAMGDIDRGQVLATRRDPFHHGARLLDGKKGVDKNRVPFTIDKCGRCRDPHPFFLARGQVAVEALAFCHKDIPFQRSTYWSGCHFVFSFCVRVLHLAWMTPPANRHVYRPDKSAKKGPDAVDYSDCGRPIPYLGAGVELPNRRDRARRAASK